MIELDDKAQSVGFDARIKFYDTLFALFPHINQAVAMGDVETWFRFLRQLKCHIFPFISEKARVDIRERELRIKDMIGLLMSSPKDARMYRNKKHDVVVDELYDLQGLMELSASHLLLPKKEEQDPSLAIFG